MPESLQVQIESAVAQVIRDLSLPGIPAGNIDRQLVPLDRDFSPTALPAIRVGPGGAERIDPRQGTNLADDVGYPVLIVLLDRANQDPSAGSHGDAWLLWREQIIHAFHHRKLSAVPSVFECIIEPRDIIAPTAWLQNNLWVSTFLIQCFARRVRD